MNGSLERFENTRSRWSPLLLTAAMLLVVPAAVPAIAQTTAASSSFGERVDLTLLPVLGGPVGIESGPLPLVAGAAEPPYDLDQTVLQVRVNGPLGIGRILDTGVLEVSAASEVPNADRVSAGSRVDDLTVGVLGLFTLTAATVTADAGVSSPSGNCGDGFAASGAATLENATIGGLLIPGGITIPVDPPPNFVLIDLPGTLRIVLNEQVAGAGSVEVNAIHVTLDLDLLGIGALDGEITIAHAAAELDCDPVDPPPPPPEEDAADLALTVAGFPNPVEVGDPWTTDWTVTNGGPDSAPEVEVEIDVPSDASVLAVSAGCFELDGFVLCQLDEIASGASRKARVVFAPQGTGLTVATGMASSPLPDPNPSDNQAAAAVEATDGPSEPPAAVACKVGTVPAATLLVPYFEVDVDDPSGATTLFSITNALSRSVLAQVTLWTDRAVPTLSFPVYLTGFDVQSFNLRDLLTSGRLPDTGSAVSPHGALSGPVETFAGCDGALPSQLTPEEVADLRALHTGRPSPVSGLCAASARTDDTRATGYVTVDVVRRCSARTPADPAYFDPGEDGVIGFANALLGEVYQVRPGDAFAQADPAVHLETDPVRFTGRTFYRSVSGGRDHRQPLGTLYGIRFLDGGGFSAGTRLVVWRDTGPAVPTICGSELGRRLHQRPPLAFDEEENVAEAALAPGAMAGALQELEVGGPELTCPDPFGWMVLDLSTELPGPGQAWVAAVISAAGEYSVGYAASQLDDPCDP